MITTQIIEEVLNEILSTNLKVTFERDHKGFHCDILKYRAGNMTHVHTGIAETPLKALDAAVKKMEKTK